jgi:hypothetical protein
MICVICVIYDPYVFFYAHQLDLSFQRFLEMIDQELRHDSQGRISKTSRIRWLIERDPIAI